MNKPIKPRKTYRCIIVDLADCATFQDILDEVKTKFADIPYDHITVDCSYDGYCNLRYDGQYEPSKEKMEEYERRMKEYNEWLKLNPPLTKEQKERRKLEKRKLELSKELAEIDKELKK